MKEPIEIGALFPDRHSGEPLGSQLTRRLRAAIESGFFPPATRLLPSRELAKQLGLARNTVTVALEQLIAEGYLEARVGDGTYVAHVPPRPRARNATTTRRLPQRARELTALQGRLDAVGSSYGALRVGAPSLATFPLRTWQRLARKNLGADMLDYGESSGLLALRQAISRHIAQFRGVVADPDQITVVDGTQGALALAAFVLARPGDRLAIEDPCYQLARSIFTGHGLVLHGVRVDDGGIRTQELPHNAALAYVSPSHQFPLGGALQLARRTELLQWANERGAYVIEDDYDSEFCLRPLPALQSLDRNERVLYVGTFSKTLAPGLRLGYIVAPPHLAPAFRFARAITSLGSSAWMHATIADFIDGGHFSRHIRRMNLLYERRRRVLVDVLEATLPPAFRTGPAQTGLHIAVEGPRRFDDAAAAEFMAEHRVLPLSALCVQRTDCKGFVLGFADGSESDVARAAQALAATLSRRLRIRK
jgi:GntR family transcriptional regulator / MocR family aminotransferase